MSNLKVGDYRAEYSNGGMSSTVFERKSLPDLYGTMTSGWERYKRCQLFPAIEEGLKLMIIVENSFTDVAAGYHRSQFEGSSMIKKLGTLWFKYHVPTVFCVGRTEMAEYIAAVFAAEGFQRLREKHAK